MTTKVFILIALALLPMSTLSQENGSHESFNTDSIGDIFNKRNIPHGLKTFLDTTFHFEVAYFKRKNYGNPFNRPTRNIRLIFEYNQDYVIYYKYLGRYVQNIVIVVDKSYRIKLKQTYCGFQIAESPIDLFEKLQSCGRTIENI